MIKISGLFLYQGSYSMRREETPFDEKVKNKKPQVSGVRYCGAAPSCRRLFVEE